MNNISKHQTVSPPHVHHDLSFLPTLFSALAGVGIGIMIGNYLGWL